MKDYKFYYVYQLINKVNGKIYVGMHATDDMDDGYLGSGKLIRRAVQKYGAENFEKIILFSHTPDLLCDFLNLVRFKKSGDQGYSAIYGSHAKRGRI